MGKHKINDESYNDNWLANVKDVITQPTVKLTLLANRRKTGYHVKIIYETSVEIVEIVTVYEEVRSVTAAVNRAICDLIVEIPQNIKIAVVKTDCKFALEEIIEGKLPTARRTNLKLQEKKIKLIVELSK